MSRFFFALVFAATLASSAYGQDLQYSTSCSVVDDRAVGYIAVRNPQSLSFSGRIIFYLYDDAGSRIATVPTVASVTTRGSHLYTVGSVPARNAYSCAVDVSSAIGPSSSGNTRRPYMTSCVIDGSTALGFIQLTQGAALSFSGRVYFHFFDDRGSFRRRDFTVASVGVIGRNRQFVAEVPARRGEVSCLLDVDEAVNR